MKQIKRGIKLGLLISLSLIILPFCYACGGGGGSENTILSVVQGEALVKKAGAGDWVKGEEKMVLKVGDSIKSGTGGNAVITFFDGSTIEIKAETQIEIAELVKGKTKIIRLKQEIGETLSKVEKLADAASRYEIETPVAVAGVRGSQMKVTVAANGVTVVQNIEGKISVTAQGVEVTIPVGSTSTVQPGQTPSTPTSNVRINSDGKGDLFDLEGKTISGYQYLDIVSEWIERDGDFWVITIELNANYPETVDSAGVVEWDIMVDADNDINTGWKSSLLFNELGVDYYLSLSRTGTKFFLNSQRTADSNNTYPHTMDYTASGNTISIRFKPDTIENSSKFSYIVLTRQYGKVGDSQSLIAADKIPDRKYYMISTASP